MKSILITFLGFISVVGFAQDSTLVLNTQMYKNNYGIKLAEKDGWVFKIGNDPAWANPNYNATDWDKLKPTALSSAMADDNGRLEGWFRLKIKLDNSFIDSLSGIGIAHKNWAAADIYLNGELIHSFGNTGTKNQPFIAYNSNNKIPVFINVDANKELLLAIHFVDFVNFEGKLRSSRDLSHFLNLIGTNYLQNNLPDKYIKRQVLSSTAAIIGVLALLFWLIFSQNRKEKHLLMIAITIVMQFVISLGFHIDIIGSSTYLEEQIYGFIASTSLVGYFLMIPLTLGEILKSNIPKTHWLIAGILLICAIGLSILNLYWLVTIAIIILSSFIMSAHHIFSSWKSLSGARWAIVAGLILTIGLVVMMIALRLSGITTDVQVWLTPIFLTFPFSLLVYVSMWFKESRLTVEKNANELIKISEEKKEILANQNVRLEQQVTERTSELNTSLENLKSTQKQLIHSEKMASLGELTAGIAHEIQNPLNFVNNFSDLNKELITELQEAIAQNDTEEVNAILEDLAENETKITHHGKRAEDIVKSMLQHSRTGSGEKELTEINVLADEYLRLSYHGLRAKIAGFNADFKIDLDPDLPKINVVPQDIGRVLLNLINNAFQAVHEKSMKAESEYKPTVTLTTELTANGQLQIAIIDNGPGIRDENRHKIFLPFFTTKAAGEGTGLGLSMSYDIITKGHGGTIEVDSQEGGGTKFIIAIPFDQKEKTSN